eukprot:m.119612 g.119612  ORF g.119612 m.119612 type:complete len:169 (-) comp21804_c0_seq1:63-569(-)
MSSCLRSGPAVSNSSFTVIITVLTSLMLKAGFADAACASTLYPKSLLWIVPIITLVICALWIGFVWSTLKNREKPRKPCGKVYPTSVPPVAQELDATNQVKDGTCLEPQSDTGREAYPLSTTDQPENCHEGDVAVDTTAILIDHDGDGCVDEVFIVQTVKRDSSDDLD